MKGLTSYHLDLLIIFTCIKIIFISIVFVIVIIINIIIIIINNSSSIRGPKR